MHDPPRPGVYVLGIDSGGTKSEALLAHGTGEFVARGYCDFRDPESGRGPGGSGRTEESLRRAVAGALGGFDLGTIGKLHVAGCGRMPRGVLPDAVDGRTEFHPVREQDGPMALVGCTAGVVALAGTGAFVYGRTEDGRELMLDALGPLLGDSGSAFDLGLRALRAVGRVAWHERHRTTLAEPLVAACRAHSGDGSFSLVEYMLQGRDRSEIAGLARIVAEHAAAGDGVAVRLVCEAADALAETLYDVVDRLGVSESELPLIAAGSLARRSQAYWSHLCKRAAAFAPRLSPVVPSRREVVGAMVAAAPGIPALADGFRERLVASTSDNG